MVSKEAIAPRLRGGIRLSVLRLHRLEEFERVFSLYLEGKAPATLVKIRAKKMLEVGLPMLR